LGRTKSVPSSWLENGTARVNNGRRKTGARPSTFFGGKRLYTLGKPCIIAERKTTRHGQNGADLVV
ncbi:hypothetical protein T11_18242, partial [Trichinella zimbabwensis]